MLFEIETNIYDSKSNTFGLDEGFVKGNMFSSIYEQYKNYKPNLEKPCDEYTLLLDHLYKLDFAITDLNLYLSIHPKDRKIYDQFKQCCLLYNKYLKEYEERFQVINLCHDTSLEYTYGNNPWPWSVDYV